ncbi:MAG: T9SS type A sorting domain-containing protein [Bacteroidales bacterium]|jgi:hypothetical protein|nr:T9SS type A sorting domain-containing protein [Bacteroidales bacterium]
MKIYLTSTTIIFTFLLSAQTTLINTSFEDYNTGNLAGQNGWICSKGNAVISEDATYVNSGNKSVKITASAGVQTDHIAFSSSQTGIDGIVYIDLWIKFPVLPSEHFSLQGFDLTSNSRNVMVEFRNDSKLKIYDGNSGADVPLNNLTYTTETWYRLSFLINNHTRTWRFAFNGSAFSKDLAFREIKTSAISLDYHSLRFTQLSGTAEIALDDFYIGDSHLSDIDFGGGTDTVPNNDTTINPPVDTIDCSQNGITRNVSNYTQLKTAIQAMNPGDIVELEDGIYSGNAITIDRSGCAERPVVIKAKNKGQAKIQGNLYFTLKNVSYITVEGLDFNINHQSVIFKLVDCSYVRITGNKLKMNIDQNDLSATSKWIQIGDTWDDLISNSHHNRIDHNFFDGKDDGGAWLVIDGAHGSSPGDASKYDRIDHNHFRNNMPRATNEKETIRIGVSDLSMSSTFTTVEYNYFENCDGDPEIISIKACDNIVRGNTFFNSLGTVCLRHGFRNTVIGNYFKSNGKIIDGNGCGGIRVYGKDHLIVNNYFENLTGEKWDAAITITNGDALNTSTNYTAHFVPENVVFAHNTYVNNKSDIEIGFTNNNNYSKPPVNCLISNNIFINDKNPIVKVHTSLSGINFSNNIMFPTGSSSIGTTLSNAQAIEINPLLELSNCRANNDDCVHLLPYSVYKLAKNSPAIDAAMANSYSNLDFEEQNRVGNKDIGADEYSLDSIKNGYLGIEYSGVDAIDFELIIATSAEREIIENNNYLSVWSNNNVLNVIYQSKNNEITCFEIYDTSGKMVLQKYNNSFIGLNRIEIPLNNIVSGIYILKIGITSVKFMN